MPSSAGLLSKDRADEGIRAPRQVAFTIDPKGERLTRYHQALTCGRFFRMMALRMPVERTLRGSGSRRPVDEPIDGHKDSALVEHLQFLGAFLRRPAEVGALLPSSPALARALLHDCHLKTAKMVVELGPGTGVVTRLILQRIGRRTDFLALELDHGHTRALKRRFPGIAVYNDSAETIRTHLKRHGRQTADYIVSGLPWTTIRSRLREDIMREVLAALAPGGVFTTFAYVHGLWLPAARRFRTWLRRHFAEVRVGEVIWRNVPPALVYHCRQTG